MHPCTACPPVDLSTDSPHTSTHALTQAATHLPTHVRTHSLTHARALAHITLAHSCTIAVHRLKSDVDSIIAASTPPTCDAASLANISTTCDDSIVVCGQLSLSLLPPKSSNVHKQRCMLYHWYKLTLLALFFSVLFSPDSYRLARCPRLQDCEPGVCQNDALCSLQRRRQWGVQVGKHGFLLFVRCVGCSF